VAAVVFAIGSCPGLSTDNAFDLARLLELARNRPAVQLADQI
jgi:hypothetical protein